MVVGKTIGRIARVVFVCVGALSMVGVRQAQAVTRYFDVNGTVAGSGVANNGVYSWESAFWNNNDTTGATATLNWEPTLAATGDFPKFAAGTDAGTTKTYTVTVNANHVINGMQLAGSGGGTLNINNAGTGMLTIQSGAQGIFVGTNGNLKINMPISQVDATTQAVWQGGGGSLYLYADNSSTLTNGIQINAANGLNFNQPGSFGPTTLPLNFGTATTTYVIANPDTTAPLTMSNPVTMRSDADTTLIWTGHDAVTWSGAWTLGTGAAPGRNNKLQIANTQFPSAKMIISNGILGDGGSNLVVQSPAVVNSALNITNLATVNGTLVVTGNSTYSGVTVLGQITGTVATPAAPSNGTPALQAVDGQGLPAASAIELNGGVYQTDTGSFTRPLAASVGQNFFWAWPSTQTAPGGGGFSAVTNQLTVNINGDGSTMQWGDTAGDAGTKILGPLKLGSATSNAKTLFTNPIDLNPAAATAPQRVVWVVAGAGGDSSEINSVISSSADPGGSPATLSKMGTGTLILSNSGNSYAGSTNIGQGTLQIASIGNAGANSVIGTSGTITFGSVVPYNTGTVPVPTSGTLKYVGTGETTDKAVNITGAAVSNNSAGANGTIDQSGASGLLKFTSGMSITGSGVHTLTLQGSTAGTGEIDGVISDGTGVLSVTKAGTGTWTLPNANTYSGTTTLSGGVLAIGNDSSLGTSAFSFGGGTLTSSSGPRSLSNTTTMTGNGTVNGSNNFTFTGTFGINANRTLTNNLSGATLTLAGPVNLSNNATNDTLTLGGTGNTTVSGVIANGGTATASKLTKTGAGTLTLTNANTYGGATTISGGTLLADNTTGTATGTGTTTVSASGTLGGTGTVGAVTNNGIISPGDPAAGPGTLSATGNVTDGANSSWSIELNGAIADKLAVTGNIDLSAIDSLNVIGTGTGTSWIIGTYSGTETGAFDNVTSGYSVTYTGGNITLNAVPACAPGDFNCDGHVDAGDYVSIRKQYSDITTGAGLTAYTAWRANFGTPPGSGSGLKGGTGVPEPTSLGLVVMGLLALASGSRRRG